MLYPLSYKASQRFALAGFEPARSFDHRTRCTPNRQSVVYAWRRSCGQRFFSELLANFRSPAGLEPATSLFPARSHHVLRTGSRRVLCLNEVVIESFKSFRFRLPPIVDWHLCLRETPVTFTSRSPDIATLGSSYVDPNGRSSSVGLRRIDEVTAQMFHIYKM